MSRRVTRTHEWLETRRQGGKAIGSKVIGQQGNKKTRKQEDKSTRADGCLSVTDSFTAAATRGANSFVSTLSLVVAGLLTRNPTAHVMSLYSVALTVFRGR